MEKAMHANRAQKVSFEEEIPFWAPSKSSSMAISGPPQGLEQGFSCTIPPHQVTKALVPFLRSSKDVEPAEKELSPMAFSDTRSKETTDIYPLLPKQSLDLPSYGLGRFHSVQESCISAPKRLEELKKWLWLQQEISPELDMGGCLHVNWFPRGLGPLQNFLRKACMARLFKGSKEKKKKEIFTLQSAQMQAALSVAEVAAAIAAVAAATAASAENESESQTGVAVASAAALVAAQCADIAENMGARPRQVVSAINAATNVKSTAGMLDLTAAAAISIQGASTLKECSRKEARVHAAVSPSERQSDTLRQSSTFQDADIKFSFNEEMLAKGCDFLVRTKNGKLHQRSTSLFLDPHKKVILKLKSRQKAGIFLKTETRIVSDIFLDITPWPGRSLLHDGEEKHYFALMTSGGILEFECKNDLDYHVWTEGISNMLFLAKKHEKQ